MKKNCSIAFVPIALIRKYLRVMRQKIYAKKYQIIKYPKQEMTVYKHICDSEWYDSFSPELYNLCKEKKVVAKFPEIDIYCLENASVREGSDLVVFEEKVWWDKYDEYEFVTLAQPADVNLVRFDKNYATIVPARKTEHINGNVFSLVGVFSHMWSHFLFQFVTKLFCAGESGLLDNNITVLTNDYNDENIEYILKMYLSQYPNVKRKIVKPGIDYVCEHLYCMRSTSSSYNDAIVYWDYRLIKPQFMIDRIFKYIVDPLTNKIKDNPKKHSKIFLSRHSNRILTNTDEVELYFKKEGFYFVEGADLSLEEKVDLFYHAEIVVGPHSSAWQNIIFCNNVKCLEFCTNRYSNEFVFYTMAKKNVIKWLKVSGQDENSDRRSDDTISLTKIKEAYNYLLESHN